MSLAGKIFALFMNLCFGILTAGVWFGIIIWHWVDLIDKGGKDG